MKPHYPYLASNNPRPIRDKPKRDWLKLWSMYLIAFALSLAIGYLALNPPQWDETPCIEVGDTTVCGSEVGER